MAMRIFLFCLLLAAHSLAKAESDAEQLTEAARLIKQSEPSVRKALQDRGVAVDEYDFAFSHNSLLVSRDGEPKVCFYIKIVWEPRDPLPDLEPAMVDRVAYGYRQNPASQFEVADPALIQALVSAWKNHTIVKEHELVAAPMTDEPAFQDLGMDFNIRVAHGCTLAYRLYRGEQQVGSMAGHMEEDPREDDAVQNPVLHALTKQLMDRAKEEATPEAH